MSISAKDIVPFSEARSHLTDLAAEVKQGQEKIITKNGKGYVALIDADNLDYYHSLAQEHIFLQLCNEAFRGLADIDEGKTITAAKLKAKYKRK